MKQLLVLAVVGSVAAALGCSGKGEADAGSDGALADAGTDSDAGRDPDVGPSADAGAPGDGGGSGELTGVVHRLSLSGTSLLAGATVQIVDAIPPRSTLTDANGAYALGASPGTLFVRASAPNAVSTQVGVVVPESFAVPDLALLDSGAEDLIATLLRLTLDPTKGIAAVGFLTSDTAGGYGATLTAAHDAPFAISSTGFPQRSTTTLSGGRNALFFPNVTAGTSEVTFTAPPGHSCSVAQPITSYRIDPGVVTEMGAICE